MSGGEPTERFVKLETRVDGLVTLFEVKLKSLEQALAANSKDTAATKKLLIGLLMSVVLATIGIELKGCVGM